MNAETTIIEDTELDSSAPPKEVKKSASDIEFNTEDVGPKNAEAMLRTARAPHLDENAIATYALAMTNDAWRQNGQPIVFDELGRLVDGVQRLNAVVRSGKKIRTLVARNVRADTLHTIDQHRRRNYAGVLESRGVENAGAVVRLLGRLIRIENGALNRDPVSISWSRYDRVLDNNPDIIDAVRFAETFRGSELHATPRSVLVFQALRAGHRDELKAFLDALDPHTEGEKLDAAMQFRMIVSAWNNDPTTKTDPDKVLGNAIAYFNAYLEGDKLPSGHVWNLERGRVRDSTGKWVPAERAVRFDRADGLRADETTLLMSDEEIEPKQLERIARKLLQKMPRKGDGDPGVPKVAARLAPKEMTSFLKDEETLRDRLRKEASRRMVEEAAPPNLGMAVVSGYQGIEGARIERNQKIDLEAGVLPELRRQSGSARRDKKVTARMVVVTPEIAAFWLSPDVNRSNRKVMMRHVKDISRDISNDRWMLNAQPISFTKDPFGDNLDGLRLLNGQHRLRAVVDAGMEIEVPIAVNVPEESFATFDVHAKKVVKTGDHSKPVDDRVMMAAARLQWRDDHGIPPYGSGPSPTASEFIATIEKHPEMENFFARSRRRGMAEMGSAGVMTYFMYKVTRDAKDIAPDFLDDLEFGENLTVDNPVHRIRQEILKGRKKMSRKEILSRLLDTWEDYRKWRKGMLKSRLKGKDASTLKTESSEGQSSLDL
jgi:hypothetical protein